MDSSPKCRSTRYGFAFSASLKACAKGKDLHKGTQVHAELVRTKLLEKDCYLGSALVNMYAKCGELANAQEVLESFPVRNVISWSAIIAGYVQHGLGNLALNCFERMLIEGLSPNSFVLVSILRACGCIGAADKGEKIHGEIVRQGLLGNNILLDNALLDMYAKCGALAKIQLVLDELPLRDVVSWNVIITGYAHYGCTEEALICFEQMWFEGLSPDTISFACVLKLCGGIGAIDKAERIIVEILQKGLLGKNNVLDNALVDMYAESGILVKAQEVFDQLPVRNAAAWSSVISGYVQHLHPDKALICFDQMQLEGVYPTAVTFTCTLKACGGLNAVDKGEKLHKEIIRLGLLQKDAVLGNALVDMYAKCGAFAKAQQVLEEVAVRNVVTWNILISSYAQHGHGREALKCFEQMQHENFSPDAVTFLCILDACIGLGTTNVGEKIHATITEKGLLSNIVLGTTLVDMYAKCGILAKAQELFDELHLRDVVCWSTLISGYAEHGHAEKALCCFENMQQEGVYPNIVTFMASLTACSIIGAADIGGKIHMEIVRHRLVAKEVALGNTLIYMYTKCGELVKAQQAFDELPIPDVVSWNTLLVCHSQHGHAEATLLCFERMQQEGYSPDAFTLSCIINACGCLRAVCKGEELHAMIVRQGLLEENVVLGNALVDMYVDCGALVKAKQVFDGMPVQDIVSWNALISGYVQSGRGEEALLLFEQIQVEGIFPSEVTYISILIACGTIGAMYKGEQVHAQAFRLGLLKENIIFGSALVDMYAKCGALVKAVELLDELPFQEIISLSALIGGYAQHGLGEEALNYFKRLQCEGHSPNAVTFLCVLNACSHSGLLVKGEFYFMSMRTDYHITPHVEHYACMVDLYGRAGLFDKVAEVMGQILFSNDLPVWIALLSACQRCRNVKLGKYSFDHVIQLVEKHSAAYVCMSNIYATAGMQEDADEIEAMSHNDRFFLVDQ